MTLDKGVSLHDLPKTHGFTSSLPPDPDLLTPDAVDTADEKLFRPRIVRNGFFCYIKPDTHETEKSTLLAVSPAAMRDLGIKWSEKDSSEFKEFAIGNKSWKKDGIHPWASLYGGWQLYVQSFASNHRIC